VSTRFFGERIKRREDPRLLTGAGRFTADLAPAGALHVAILRSPHAHARIRSADVSAARAAAGVALVAAAPDLGPAARPFPLLIPNLNLRPRMPSALARDETHYVGEPVAAVVARDRYAAEDALDLIRVDYEAIPAVADPLMALEPGAPLVHDGLDSNLAARLVQAIGEAEAAFRRADVVIRERFAVCRGGGASMEGRAILAQWDARAGKLSVWSSTQVPHLVRRVIAELLDLPEHDIRVAAPDVGGAFGAKLICYSEDVLVPWLALRVGRPVLWVEDRVENLLTSVQEREQVHEAELALRRDGTILGLRDRFVCDTGAFVPWGVVFPTITATTGLGPYRIPHYRVEVQVVYTNRVPVSVIRGAGRPQATFVMDRLVDRAAEALGLDPAEIRFKNFIQPHEFPYRVGLVFRDGSEMVYDNGDYPAGLRKVLEMADHRAFRAEQRRLREQGLHVGLGIATYVEGTGMGPFEGATIRVDAKGMVHVATGACPQGQGHETVLAQVCAEELGVPLERVRVTTGDTEAIGFGIGTFASRTAIVASGAVVTAARQVVEKGVALAAHLLEAAREDVVYEAGRFFVRGAPARALSLAEVGGFAAGRPGVALPAGVEGGLYATHYFHPPGLTYSSGAHVAIVEVDPDLGAVRLLRYLIVHDCGRVINPLLVEGQIHGGVVHGISTTLFERPAYDAAAAPLATTFMDYLLPTAAEVPTFEIEHIETPSPLNPAGVKGAGESGTIPSSAAIGAAVEDALAPFGVRINELPLPPERLRALIGAGAGGRLPPPSPSGRGSG
jgi:carbon-monoxide dehydrogenase large subunit